jgi:hypothetical protein
MLVARSRDARRRRRICPGLTMTRCPTPFRAWLLLACCTPSMATATGIERYEGIAHDAAGHVVYRESHWLSGLSPTRDLLVLFRCPDGRPFARKQVQESGRPLAPSFELDDVRFGYREGVRARVDGQREIHIRRRTDEPEKVAVLDDTPGLVIDAGIDAYIKANWDALVDGQSRSMPFVVPSRLRTYVFRIARVDGAARSADTRHRFRLEIDAWYAFAIDSIDMVYDAKTQRLSEYVGIANVRNQAGKSLVVRIDFPPRRVHDVALAERDAALAAPLDGRCVL